MARPQVVVVHARNGDGSPIAARLASSPVEIVPIAIGRTMLELVQERGAPVVIVDHEAGDFDVARVCRDLGSSVESWIIVVGNDHDSDDDAIRLLDAGADSLLPRSASSSLLLAHIRVGLRTRPVIAPSRVLLEVGDVVVDLNAHEAFIAGTAVKCPPRQFLLLAALARHPNVVIGHDALMTSVWGDPGDEFDPRRLRIAISLLRGVLGSGPNRPRIETVPHVGYRLVVNRERQNSG